jgi:hypothetical protein
MNRKLVIGSALALLLFAAAARAGLKSPGLSVNIGLLGSGSYFYGTMATVRSSANALEYIGCSIRYNLPTGPSSNLVNCVARDATGMTVTCMATGPAEWNPLAGMTGSSHLDISFNQNTGACNAVRVINPSYFPIVQP